MENTEKSAAPAATGSAGGAKDKIEKQARQLAYDVRYKVRQGLKAQAGGKSDPAAVRKSYLGQLAKSPSNPAVKTRAKQMLMGEGYIDVDNLVAKGTASAMFKVFVEHHQKDGEGNTIPHEEINEDETKEKTYKVRVTDKESGNSYVRNASRAKIAELRNNPNISSVEMTEYGEVTKSEKTKGSKTASVKSGKGVDYDGDGKVESGSKEHAGVVHNAIQKKKGGTPDGKDTRKEDYTWKDAFGELIEKAKSNEEDKKITGEGVDNKKLIKVFPDDIKEGYGKKKDSDCVSKSEKNEHNCAKKVCHEKYGIGNCIPEQHTILEDGTVSHYDVEFEEYIVENCPVEDLEILVTEMHSHSAKKKVSEGAVTKEVEDLQTAAETGKGKYVAKADAQPDVGGTPASKQDEVEDPRSMYTKWNLVKNRLRAMGLKMSHEPEGETIEESEAVAQGARKRAQELGAARRKREGVNRGVDKNERAGYKLSQAASSSGSSLETQRTKKKRPAGDDTSQIGHYKNRDAKRTTSKTGKPLKKPVNKLSLSQRVDHHSNKALNRRDPKQNPKHTANESVLSALDSLNTYYAKNDKLHGSIVQKEDAALDFVKKKIEKEVGKGGYVSKDNPRKPQSAADKAKARAHQSKVDAENAAERKKDPSQGRYPKG